MSALSNPITHSDLVHARSLAEQGKLSDMYDYLAARGDRYSILAKGVVEGDTLSGRLHWSSWSRRLNRRVER